MVSNPEFIDKVCADCDQIFRLELGKRGSPRKYCPTCRPSQRAAGGQPLPKDPAPPLEVPEYNFSNSRIKQSVRLAKIGYFEAGHPEKMDRLYGLSLPGIEALANPESLERVTHDTYPNMVWTFAESDRARQDLICQQVESLPSWRSRERYLGLAKSEIHEFLNRIHDLPGLPKHFDLIDLDLMGNLADILKTVQLILERRLLNPDGGMLSLTGGINGRTKEKNLTLAEDQDKAVIAVRDYILELGQKEGYKFYRKVYDNKYACVDESKNALPMVCMIFITGTKASSKTAYKGAKEEPFAAGEISTWADQME